MAKKNNINDSKDRFSAPIGIKNLVLPKSGNAGKAAGKRKSSSKKK